MSTSKQLRRESDLSSLREERAANAIPWSISPFRQSDGEAMKELEPGELRVAATEEVPFIDLLLEIAMTTAFAGLTDGTPILQWDNALSYVAFFIWVWWIWVAQVAYNMRFRQADWFHKMMVFAQLIVFSAMAAFTESFDITTGLSNDPTQQQANAILSSLGFTNNALSATMFRGNRLPILNSRGVSMAMAVSRVILLIQYLAVLYHAKRQLLPCSSLWAHVLPLIFSSGCYFAVFGLLFIGGTEGTPEAVHIIKLVLWYTPIVVEVASHFIALNLPGYVGYPTEVIYARSGTVFLIILGAGLDKITGGFKDLVGNAGLGSNGIPVFVSAAVIFIGYFSLYFGTPGSNRELSSSRALAWFFSQFFFLSALIVAVQGIATAISFANLNSALLNVDSALGYAFDWQANHLDANLTASKFPESIYLFNNLGLSFQDVVDYLNSINYLAVQSNDTSIIFNGEVQTELQVFASLLQTLDALPDPSSLLYAKLDLLTTVDVTNSSALSASNFFDVFSGIVSDRGSSALWFYPASGATIVALVLMSCIKGMPRDKYEWGVLGTRCTIGTAVCFLALLDIGSSKPVYDSNGDLTDSKIWLISISYGHWLLIIMAIIMAIVIITENLFAYAANRSYHSFEHLDFLDGPERRRTKRRKAQYQKTFSVDAEDSSHPLTPPMDEKGAGYSYFNPYEGTSGGAYVTSPKST